MPKSDRYVVQCYDRNMVAIGEPFTVECAKPSVLADCVDVHAVVRSRIRSSAAYRSATTYTCELLHDARKVTFDGQYI